MTAPEILQPPALDHDALMLKKYQCGVSVNGKLERRIVWNLLKHLEKHGWLPSLLDDGDEEVPVTDPKAAMELIFDLDDARLYMAKNGQDHAIRLIMGNGVDIVSDYTYSMFDEDGFGKLVGDFNAEDYA